AALALHALALHDALPIWHFHKARCGLRGDGENPANQIDDGRTARTHDFQRYRQEKRRQSIPEVALGVRLVRIDPHSVFVDRGKLDRKSTRLNSSHVKISY